MGRVRQGSGTDRWIGVLAVLVLAGVGTVLVLYAEGLDRATKWVTLLGFPVALVAAYLAWRGPRAGDRSPTDLNQVATELAEVVREQWQAEERTLRLQDPVPIPVRWIRTEQHADHRRNTQAQSGRSSDRHAASGTVDRIAESYRRLPTGRLVVLGEAGAGKSVLCVELVLGLLNEPAPGAPVPVLIRLASWDPLRQHPWDYAAEQLIADFPSLAAPVVSGDTPGLGGLRGAWARRANRRATRNRHETVARALLRTGRLLPVLDGLDEMPAESRSRALRGLNAELNRDDAMVLTSRPEEYEEAVRDGHQLIGAAVIRLRPLRAAELAAFLPRTTRAVPESERDKWSPVVDQVRAHPRGVLAQALSTPLMASLARNIYSDTDKDPVELLDREAFPDRRALADHLLNEFLPAVYDGPPGLRDDESEQSGARRGHGRWTSARARRWLAALASRASESQGDIAWWRLGGATARALVAAFVLLAFGVVVLLSWWLSFPGTVAIGPVDSGMPAWVGLVLLGGGPTIYLTIKLSKRIPLPGTASWQRVVATVFWLGSLGAFAVGLLIMDWLPAFAWWIYAMGLLNAVSLLYDDKMGTGATSPAADRARDPLSVLRNDRSRTLTLASEGATTAALGLFLFVMAQPLALLLVWNSRAAISPTALAVTVGCSFALLIGAGALVTAWGRFGVVRIALALTAGTPLRLMTFLVDAHQRGVLRHHGGVYRFRHAELLDHLRHSPTGSGARLGARARPIRNHGGKYGKMLLRWGTVGAIGVSLIGSLAGMAAVARVLPAQPGPYRDIASACELLFPNRKVLTAARETDVVSSYEALGGEVCGWYRSGTPDQPSWSVDLTVWGPHDGALGHPATEIATGVFERETDTMAEARKLPLGDEAYVSGFTNRGCKIILRDGNVVLRLAVTATVWDKDLVIDYAERLAETVVLERAADTVRPVRPPWPLVGGA